MATTPTTIPTTSPARNIGRTKGEAAETAADDVTLAATICPRAPYSQVLDIGNQDAERKKTATSLIRTTLKGPRTTRTTQDCSRENELRDSCLKGMVVGVREIDTVVRGMQGFLGIEAETGGRVAAWMVAETLLMDFRAEMEVDIAVWVVAAVVVTVVAMTVGMAQEAGE